jgi:hypothetical protein
MPGVCIGTVEDTFNSMEEPYLAIHPRDHRIMAIGAHSTSTMAATTEPIGVDVVRIAVYFTEDGGASWRRTVTPRVELASAFDPVEARFYYDPALAFDNDGVLHVAGIASNDLGPAGGVEWDAENAPFHVSTPDLGATWTEPTVLDNAFTDRAFIAVSSDGKEVFVNWLRFSEDEDVAQLSWSRDGGSTWSSVSTPGCRGFSPPVTVPGGAEMVCVAGTAVLPDEASLLRFDAAAGTFSTVAEIPGVAGYRPRLGLLPGDGRVVAAEADTIHAAASFNGGATWGEAVDLLPLTDITEPATFLKWAAPDPWGGLHLEVGGTAMDGCQGGNRGAPGTCVFFHFAFDPHDWTLLKQARLSEFGPTALRVPGNVPPPMETNFGDDFYSFAFAADHGVLLWTRDGNTDFTYVLPEFT